MLIKLLKITIIEKSRFHPRTFRMIIFQHKIVAHQIRSAAMESASVVWVDTNLMGQFALTPMSVQMIQKIIVTQMLTVKTLMADFYVPVRYWFKN